MLLSEPKNELFLASYSNFDINNFSKVVSSGQYLRCHNQSIIFYAPDMQSLLAGRTTPVQFFFSSPSDTRKLSHEATPTTKRKSEYTCKDHDLLLIQNLLYKNFECPRNYALVALVVVMTP